MSSHHALLVLPSYLVCLMICLMAAEHVNADRGILNTIASSVDSSSPSHSVTSAISSSPANSPHESQKKRHDPTITIVAVVLGVFFLLGFVAVIAVVVVRRRRKIDTLTTECGIKPPLPCDQSKLRVVVHLPVKIQDQIDSPVDFQVDPVDITQ
ncbi:hypothetical protein CPB86DRAFT_874685 [Serendipita vermifera]|nr:hypothetical protein CPB86DRAFT_874685 [Serendipita vermifera]